MLKSVEGIYPEGKIELLEIPDNVDEAQVIVTFLPEKKRIDLNTRGIDADQAKDLRQRLHSFGEDWDRPEMDVYDAL